ncbi:MAG: SMC family ATPase [Armatimonadetes bacterium]|nr:SMC family ATPase [Armatimonadota bacterium]MDW8122731.1 SMC family ATPase [Armatimonadota bacterium]
MVPLRLKMRNFLSYGNNPVEVDLSQVHMVAIVGNNGAGKSALLDAITWALFGTARSNNPHLIRKGATEMEVTLEFDAYGDGYRVYRRLNQGSKKIQATARLEVRHLGAWKMVTSKVDAVTDQIKQILRMDYDTFTNTIFSRQGESDRFMRLGPAQRRDLLAELLGLGTYEDLHTKARDETKAKDNALQANRSEQEQIRKEVASLPEWEKKRSHLASLLEQIKRRMADNESQQKALYEQKAKIEGAKEALAQATKEIQRLDEDRKNSEERLEKEKQTLAEWESLLARTEEIEQTYQSYKELDAQIRKLQKLRQQWDRLTEEKHRLEAAVAEAQYTLKRQISILQERLEGIKRRKEEIHKELKTKSELEEKQRRLITEVSQIEVWEEKKQQDQQWQEKWNRWEREIQTQRATARQHIANLQQHIKRLETRLLEKPSIQAHLEQLQAENEKLSRLEEQRRSLDQEARDLREELKLLEQKKHERSRQQAEIEEKRKLMMVHREEPYCPLCESPLTPEKAQALLDQMGKELDRIRQDLLQIEQKQTDNRKRLEKIGEQIQQLETELGRKPEVLHSIGELQGQIRALDQVEKEKLEAEASLKKEQEFLAQMEKTWEDQKRQLQQEREEIGYDPDAHKALLNKKEELARVQEQIQVLERRQQELEQIEGEEQKELEKEKNLLDFLQSGRYAEEERRRLIQIEKELAQLGYDHQKHTQAEQAREQLQFIVEEFNRLKEAKKRISEIKQTINDLKRSIEELVRRKEEKEKNIASWKQIIATEPTLEEKIQQCDQEAEALRKENDAKNQEIATVDYTIRSLREKQENLRKLEAAAAILEEDIANLSILEEAFSRGGIPKMVLSQAVRHLQDEVNHYLSRLTNGRLTLSINLTTPTAKGDQKETVAIAVQDDFSERPYENYSGGERFRIDFALRVGLARLLAGRSGAALRTLIIDEGFGTQDKEGLEALTEVLREIGRDFDLIMIVTHLTDLRDRFPAMIEVSKGTDGSQCKLTVPDFAGA